MQKEQMGLPSQPLVLLKREVLGVGVTLTERSEEVVAAVLTAARERRPFMVSALNVHALMLAASEPPMRDAIRRADIVTADGQPVRWALNSLHGLRFERRLCGPDLTLATCEAAAREGVPVYFYGSLPAVLEPLQRRLRERFPRLRIVGAYAPRMRPRHFPPPVDDPEDREDVARISASGAELVFVGLGCPLQEMWAAAQRERVSMPLLCIGAAFDFLAGVKPRAPVWMQTHGLEWLYRLASEPRRLGGRYVRYNSLFLLHLARAFGTGLFRRALTPRAPDAPSI